MAVGLAIAAGAMAVGGLVQLYNAEKARGANKKRLEDIEKLYKDIVPPDYDLTIEQPPNLHSERLRMPQFSSIDAGPKWNLDKLEPNQLEMIQNFSPKIAELVVEQNPTLLKKSEDMKLGAAAQKTALRRFMDIGEGGYDPQHAQRVKEARDRSQAEAQSRSASTMQDFARRGVGGSGMELAAKLGTNASAMDRNAQMGLAAEADAYRNQLSALSQGASLGGQIQDRDMRMQGQNAEIINNFNARMSKRHQDWNNNRAAALNQADLRNIQEAQRIADQNTMTKNKYDQVHQGRMDDFAQRDYAAKVDELNRQDSLKKWGYAQEGAERSYRDNANILRSKWNQGERRNQNQLKSQAYNDQMGLLAGRAGASSAIGQAGLQGAADQNAAIQGLSNIGMGYAMQQNANEQRGLDRQAFRRRQPTSYDYGGGYLNEGNMYAYGGPR